MISYPTYTECINHFRDILKGINSDAKIKIYLNDDDYYVFENARNMLGFSAMEYIKHIYPRVDFFKIVQNKLDFTAPRVA